MKAKNDTLPAEVNTTQLLKSLVGKLAGLFSWEENDTQHRSNTPCRHPGCAALVPYGQKYCEVHKPQHPEEVRTVSGRGYGKIEVLKPEKVPGTRTKKQTIVIYWNFIGAVEIPDEAEKTA